MSDFQKMASSGLSLDARVDANKKSQKINFGDWAHNFLSPRLNDDVLEVGCGTGSQTITISRAIGKGGSITFLDISAESVSKVEAEVMGVTRAKGVVGDMDSLSALIGDSDQNYDLAFSAYAIYYAKFPKEVLQTMTQRLKPNGKLCILGPETPHGFVELARKFHAIPDGVDLSLNFRTSVLESFLKENFGVVQTSIIKNPQYFTNPEDVMNFYRNTTYFVSKSEIEIGRYVELEFKKRSTFVLDKYSYASCATERLY